MLSIPKGRKTCACWKVEERASPDATERSHVGVLTPPSD
jgi:hypothetical protein